ncbi:hypothetical protein ACFOPQ_07630, partial [Deinococcus antarcticus]
FHSCTQRSSFTSRFHCALETLVYQKAGVTVDYASASVISVVMLLLTLLVAGVLRGRAQGRR